MDKLVNNGEVAAAVEIDRSSDEVQVEVEPVLKISASDVNLTKVPATAVDNIHKVTEKAEKGGRQSVSKISKIAEIVPNNGIQGRNTKSQIRLNDPQISITDSMVKIDTSKTSLIGIGNTTAALANNNTTAETSVVQKDMKDLVSSPY